MIFKLRSRLNKGLGYQNIWTDGKMLPQEYWYMWYQSRTFCSEDLFVKGFIHVKNDKKGYIPWLKNLEAPEMSNNIETLKL